MKYNIIIDRYLERYRTKFDNNNLNCLCNKKKLRHAEIMHFIIQDPLLMRLSEILIN